MGLKKAIASICLPCLRKGPAKQDKISRFTQACKVLINYTQVTSIDLGFRGPKSLQNSKVPFSNKHRFDFFYRFNISCPWALL